MANPALNDLTGVCRDFIALSCYIVFEKDNTTRKVLAVGDAAGHTVPTVGGGVPPGLICGRIAGQIVANHIQKERPLNLFDAAWRDQIGITLENSLVLRRMSDIVFKNEKMIDLVIRRGWLTEEMVEKFILCKVDTKMKLIEKTLRLMVQT